MKNGTPYSAAPQTVTPAQAIKWLTERRYLRQRVLSQLHVKALAQIIRAGHFRETTDVSFAVLPDGTRYLVNGQHTLAAIVESEIPQTVLVVEYPCQTQSAVDIHYTRYDRGRTRTLQSSYAAVEFGDSYGFTATQVSNLASAVVVLAAGFSAGSHSSLMVIGSPLAAYLRDTEVRMALMQEWTREAGVYFADIAGSAPDIHALFVRSPVMAIALATYRATIESETQDDGEVVSTFGASAFWKEAAKDNGLQSSDPRKTLLRWLMQHKLAPIGYKMYPRYVASCWNAHAKGNTSLKKVYARDVSLPILIEDTPHDGEHVYVYLSDTGAVLDHPVIL